MNLLALLISATLSSVPCQGNGLNETLPDGPLVVVDEHLGTPISLKNLKGIDQDTIGKPAWVLNEIGRTYSFARNTTCEDRIEFAQAYYVSRCPRDPNLYTTTKKEYVDLFDRSELCDRERWAQQWLHRRGILPKNGNKTDEQRFVREAILDGSELCFRAIAKDFERYGVMKQLVLIPRSEAPQKTDASAVYDRAANLVTYHKIGQMELLELLKR